MEPLNRCRADGVDGERLMDVLIREVEVEGGGATRASARSPASLTQRTAEKMNNYSFNVFWFRFFSPQFPLLDA